MLKLRDLEHNMQLYITVALAETLSMVLIKDDSVSMKVEGLEADLFECREKEVRY